MFFKRIQRKHEIHNTDDKWSSLHSSVKHPKG